MVNVLTGAPTAEPSTPKPAPVEARCAACGEWLSTVPPGTTWVRARCINRRCRRYGEGQTVHLR